MSLPLSIVFGHRGPAFKSPDDANKNDDLAFSGQFVGDFGFHAKGRFLNGHRFPVGPGGAALALRSDGRPITRFSARGR